MKLLIVTQAVDRADPVLGFFHEWIAALASRYEQISVICLYQGTQSLPDNVRVYSLGKERGKVSKFRYAFRFWRLIRRLVKDYDAAFVHMNEEYVLLGGRYWRKHGKRIYMWRNHYSGSRMTDRAAAYCDKIFCTSKYSYTAKFPKTVFMPVGVDLDRFTLVADATRDPRGVLFLARMAPSKKPDLLLRALGELKKRGVGFSAAFYGAPAEHDTPYYESLLALARELDVEKEVKFAGAVPNAETPRLYNSYSVFVNCSASGMFDKTIFEAAACECLPLASSADYGELIDERFSFKGDQVEDLVRKLERLLSLPFIERQGLGVQMRHLADHHGLKTLALRLAQELA